MLFFQPINLFVLVYTKYISCELPLAEEKVVLLSLTVCISPVNFLWQKRRLCCCYSKYVYIHKVYTHPKAFEWLPTQSSSSKPKH
jgi:hypothetical protein